jgi:signal transduction histidine kinase
MRRRNPFRQNRMQAPGTNETYNMPLVRINATLAYLLAYLAAVLLGRIAVLEGGLALCWPAAGVAAVWMLRGTTRQRVAGDALLLFASSVLIFLVVGLRPGAALLLGAANVVQGLVVRALRARFERLPLSAPLTGGLSTSRDLLWLVQASTAAAILSSPFGMTGAWLNNNDWSWLTVVGWVVRNSCGTLVVAAVALTLVTAHRAGPYPTFSRVLTAEPRRHSTLELVAATGLTLGSGYLVFSAPATLPIAYVMIATSAWIGLRFSPVVGAVHSFGFGTLALLCTFAGWGPFGSVHDPGQRAIMVQFFVAVTAVIVLMLAFGVSERLALTNRLRESEAEARSRADLVDAVTAVMIEGLVVIDATGKILLSNPAAELMAGNGSAAPHVSARDRGFFRLDGTEMPAAERPHARALLGESVPPTDLLRIDPQTGQQRILSVSAAPLHPPTSDEPAVAVLVLNDVTKARAQQRELESYAGVVAHDLKNPLTGVISWAEILDEQLDETTIVSPHDLRASLNRIRSSAGRMDDLISDLLTYTHAQSAELAREPVSLDAMVDQIARDLRETHRAEIPVVEHVPLGRVLADQTLVRQLLTNLIGNAVKYVAPGVIPHIVIGSAPMEDMLEVWVTDNGLGIPDRDLGRVFDSFFRVSSTQNYPGTGLGLAICARTVERHGGRISARKGPDGQGTMMIFTLPLAPAGPLSDSDQPGLEPVSATS